MAGMDDSDFVRGANNIRETIHETTRDVKQTGMTIDDVFGNLSAHIEETASAAKASADKFKESSAEADRLKNELRELAESGAGAEELIAKARELGDAQRKAANDGAEALEANRKYWTALNMAGADISEVQSRHQELAASYTEMARQANQTKTAVENYSSRLNEEKAKLEEVKNAADKTKDSTDRLSGSTGKAAESSKAFSDKLGEASNGARGLPGPVGDAVSSVNGLTKATLRFIATPVGAVLAAISAALAMVTSWFKRTEEGQNAMAVGSAYFTQVLGSLLDVVDDVGEWLYKAFTKPKAAMVDLVDFLKGQVLNRLKAVGEMSQGIWKMLSGDFSEGFNQFTNGYLQGITGVQNVTGKIGSWMADTNRKAEQRMAIAREQNELDRKERENLVERAKLEKEINELREKAYDKSVPEKERAKAIKEAQDKTKKMYDEELSLARERYEIIRDTNSLTHSNKEDKKKEAEAEAELYRIESQRATAMKGLLREQNRVDSSESKAGRAAAKAAKESADERQKLYDLELRQQEEQAKKVQDAENALAAARISGIKSGSERERRERANQHRLALQQLAAEEEEMKRSLVASIRSRWEAQKENKGKAWADTALAKDVAKNGYANIVLSDEDVRLLRARREQINAEWKRQEQEAAEALIKEHQSYTDKKIAIDKRYKEDVEAINAAIAEADKAGNAEQVEALKRSLAEAAKERAKSQAQLSLEQLKETPEYVRAFEDLEQTGTRTLQTLIGMFEEAKQSAAESMNPEDLREYTDTLQQLYDEMNSRDPFKAMADSGKKLEEAQKKAKEASARLAAVQKGAQIPAAYELDKATNKIITRYLTLGEAEADLAEAEDEEARARAEHKKAVKESCDKIDELAAAISGLGSSMGGLGGEILGIIGDVMSVTTGMINALTFTSQAASVAIQTVEKASVILAVISAALQVIMKIADIVKGLFGADGEQFENAKQKYEALIDVWEELIEKKREYLDESWGKEAKAVTEEILRLLEAEQKQTEILARQRLNVTNGSHSMWYRMWEGSYTSKRSDNNGALNPDASAFWGVINWRDVNKAIEQGIRDAGLGDVTFNAMEDMLTFTSEQLDWIKTQYTGLWTAMDDDFRELLEKHAELEQQMADAIRQKQERMTGTTAEDVISEFMEHLYDMADGSGDVMEEVATNWQKMVNRMAVNTVVGESLKKRLSSWYESLAKVEEDYTDGLFDEREYQRRLADLQTEYNNTLEDTQRKMDALKKVGAIKSVAEETEDAKKNLTGLRDMFADTLTDMEADAKSWSRNISEMMFKDILSRRLLDEKFQSWLDDWEKRYDAALNTPGQEKRLDALRKELEDMREKLSAESQKLFDTLGLSEFLSENESMLKDLRSQFVDFFAGTERDAKAFVSSLRDTIRRQLIEQSVFNSSSVAKELETWQSELDRIMSLENISEAEKAYRVNKHMELLDAILANGQKFADAINSQLRTVGEAADTTFSDMESSFVSALMDMDGDLNDFTNNLKKTIVQKMVEGFMVSEKIKPILDDLQDTFSYAMGLEGATPDQRAKLVAGGYTDENGEVHSGVDSVAKTLEPLKGIVKAMLEAIGYTVKETGEEVDKSLSSIASNMTNALMDGSKGAEDFAKNLKETIVNGLVEAYTATEDFQEGLKAVKDNLQAAIESGDREAIEQAERAAKAFFDSTAKAVEGYTDALKDAEGDTNKFAGIFEDMTDSWVSNLMDFEGTVEGWSEDVGRMITKNILEQIIAPKMTKPMLDSLQSAFDQAVEDVTGVDGDVDWESLLVHEGLFAALEEMKQSYPELKEAAGKILGAFGITKKDDIDEAAKAFDSLTSTIVDGLTDAEMTAEKFGANLAKTLTTDMMEAMLNANYAQEISGIQADWAKALTEGNDQAIEDIKKRIVQLYKDMGRDTDELRKVFEEIQNETAELPFSGLRDAILSSLTDTDMSAGKFGKKIALDLMNEMLETLFDKRFGDSIKRIREMWQSVLNGESTYTYEQVLKEISDLRESIMQPGTTYSAITDEIKELEKSLNGADEQAKEAFSGLGDRLVSSLMDADMTAEKFGKDIARTLVEQMLRQIVDSRFAERMNAIQSEWAKALESGDREAIVRVREDIVRLQQDVAGATQELTDSVKEVIEADDTTFSGMTSSWVSALMDMEKTAEDFAQDVGRTMAQKIIEEMIVPMSIQPLLDRLQQAVDEAFKASDATWGSVVAAMQPFIGEITEAYESIRPLVEEIFNSFGIYRDVTEEVQEAVEEVKYSLQDMRGEFVSTLMDMKGDAEDFGDEVSEILARSFIDRFVLGDVFQQQMLRWQQEFEDITTGSMSEDERARQLRQLRDAIASAKEGYAAQADAVKQLLGLNASDDARATMSGIDKLTAEQGDLLVGLGTSLVIGQQEGNSLLSQILGTVTGGTVMASPQSDVYAKQILSTLQNMAAVTSPGGDTLDRMYPYVVASEGHLADIMRTNRDLVEQVNRLVANTNNLRNI